jgi:O-methyltransferase
MNYDPGPPSRKALEVAPSAYANISTLAATERLARDVIARRVAGDFVECGVANGVQCALMAHAALDDTDYRRLVHLFDSFQGIPEAGPKDDETITGLIGRPAGAPQLRTTGFVAISQAAVQANMARWGIPADRLVYHPGWFQHTVAKAASQIPAISVLRLDGDLYESTKVCLEALEPNVPVGGVIIIDDYALTGCRAACDEYFGGRRRRVQAIKDGGGPVFWIKE